MKLASFDIGIRNMAMCILEVSENQLYIRDWQVINLLDQATAQEIPLCQCATGKKPKKNPKNETVVSTCSRASKYEKNGRYFCETHAKGSVEWILPTKEITPPFLRKLKVDELDALIQKYQIPVTTGTKKQRLEEVLGFFGAKCFVRLGKPVEKTANDTDLITVGRNMRTLLDSIQEQKDVTHVIMENQISTIATRMKAVQGMLAQYYIMSSPHSEIEFISSANKLKDFPHFTKILPKSESTQKDRYRQHKADAIQIARQIVEKTATLQSWSTSLETSKKDDLADCFLQGLWYLRNGNILSYADDLEINIVS